MIVPAFDVLAERMRALGLPAGERVRGQADTTKANSLGWHPEKRLDEYLAEFVAAHPR